MEKKSYLGAVVILALIAIPGYMAITSYHSAPRQNSIFIEPRVCLVFENADDAAKYEQMQKISVSRPPTIRPYHPGDDCRGNNGVVTIAPPKIAMSHIALYGTFSQQTDTGSRTIVFDENGATARWEYKICTNLSKSCAVTRSIPDRVSYYANSAIKIGEIQFYVINEEDIFHPSLGEFRRVRG